MSAEAYQDSVFDLDGEQLDALRLEIQSVDPDEQENIRQLVGEVHDSFMRHLARYTSFNIDREQMMSKFITTDPDLFHEFTYKWRETRGKVFQSYTNGDGKAEAFANIGNFVVSAESLITDHFSSETWEEMLNDSGLSEDDLMILVTKILDTTVVAHEMIHLYQFPTELTPLWLIECQAYWATTRLLRHCLSTTQTQALVDFYQYLLDKYGDAVHRLCFGAQEYVELSDMLKAEFTPEVRQALFPEYQEDVVMDDN